MGVLDIFQGADESSMFSYWPSTTSRGWLIFWSNLDFMRDTSCKDPVDGNRDFGGESSLITMPLRIAHTSLKRLRYQDCVCNDFAISAHREQHGGVTPHLAQRIVNRFY